MGQYDREQRAFATTLRALSYLMRYPDTQWRSHLDEVGEAIVDANALSHARLERVGALIEQIRQADALDAEAAYVELFDRGRGTALHLFEHVHGDSRERGPAMLDLIATYEQAGLAMRTDELPDHLTVLLEYASTQPREAAVALLGEVAHILRRIHGAVDKRGSAYAAVLGALLELAGKRADALEPALEAEAEPDLDETWQEPAAFDGCGNQGQQGGQSQAVAGQPQPVRIVRRAPNAESPAAHSAAQGARA
ncbi:nitrate reductase molybdenum cofactor assembly chaperone [Trinickia dabaoshanensis]|uniref:Nitrate reductase molybdenum cofactor assembly chaperone n=1 Tax=Trinickia dabaoshanensis TaxID=564714 RepID=A0A2N7W2N9_9BURK|nr:nitrate reductase molybdenum cofactor assembly chaperone [Trinickia dabaoshanensis]PMS23623.1 nitrate reductase molybdenum cofactor assembly chaperone [Trinickia dabaoshanensis]